jgi:SAM-dependent methyltransferase
MFSNNELISIQGFNYLFEIVVSQRTSKIQLRELLNSLYSNFNFSSNKSLNNTQKQLQEFRKKREDKKEMQYDSLIRIINALNLEGSILELGCGNGDLSKTLAIEYNRKVIGLDRNAQLIESLNKETLSDNLRFILPEQMPSIENDFTLTLGLHCCGNFSDQVLRLSYESKAEKKAVISVPCCYGKINKIAKVLPRSQLLKDSSEICYLISRVRSLEGYVDNLNSRPAILLELYRRLIDFDRIFYLQERGYKTCFLKLSRPKEQDEKDYSKDSLMSAIIGMKN